jgi:hypothetical protein
MINTYSPLILSLFVLICYQVNSFAQCPPNGITTNPSAPINTQAPSKLNTFEWRNQTFPINSYYSIPGELTFSPFYQTDNIPINHFIDNKDMQPEDGWEIIRKDFGYLDDGTPSSVPITHPYLVLYNKYTAIMRVFVAKGDNPAYTGARIKIEFLGGQDLMKTSLLDLSAGFIAFDKPFTNKIYQSIAQFLNGKWKWFYADFPMQYDPCTCLLGSKLGITIFLINQFWICECDMP